MSKKIVGLIIVVLVIIGGYFVLSGNKGTENENLGEVKEEGTGKKMAFSQFLKQGGAYKCEVKQYMNDFENSGTMYVDGKNLRGEFSTVAEGRTIDSSFISRDGYTYNWSSMTPGMGFKMMTGENEETPGANIDASGTYNWDAGQIGDYNCENWAVDSSKFEVPKDVVFQEILLK